MKHQSITCESLWLLKLEIEMVNMLTCFNIAAVCND